MMGVRKLAELLAGCFLTLFTIYWDALPPEQYVIKYRVYRALTEAGPFSLLKTVTTLSTRVEVPAGEQRCYKIRAVNELGQVGPYSQTLCLGG